MEGPCCYRGGTVQVGTLLASQGGLVPWRGPESPDDFPSLGWGFLEWCAEHLPSPRDPSEPMIFTDEQAWQLIEWYRLDPITGRRVHRRGYSRRSKGWGKSPVEAAKAIGEFVGPVRFDGWDANGEPVGRPWGYNDDPRPWVQIGAISEDQTDNTWSVIHYLLTENDGRAADALRIDAGLTRCLHRDMAGAKLEPVTSAAGSREGQPLTYGVLDESHLMTASNGGVKLAATIRRNVAKMGGTSYETTNSFIIGQGSVAESSYEAVRAGAPGVFADELEAPRQINGVDVSIEAPDDVLIAALDVAYGKSWWVDKERLVADIRDPSNKWTDSARFFLNWNMTDVWQEAKLPAEQWTTAHTKEVVPVEAKRCVFAVDAAPGGKWVSVAVGAGHQTEPYVEVIKHAPGTAWVPDYLVERVKKWKPLAIGIDALGPGGGLVGPIQAAFKDAGIDPELLRIVNTSELKQWCEALYVDVLEGRLRVPELSGPLDLAVANASERRVGDGWMWDRRDPSVALSPLVSATIARGLAVELIPNKPRNDAWLAWE